MSLKMQNHTTRSLRPLKFIKIKAKNTKKCSRPLKPIKIFGLGSPYKALKTWNCRQKHKTVLKTFQLNQDIRSRLLLQSLKNVELSSKTPNVAQDLSSYATQSSSTHNLPLALSLALALALVFSRFLSFRTQLTQYSQVPHTKSFKNMELSS